MLRKSFLLTIPMFVAGTWLVGCVPAPAPPGGGPGPILPWNWFTGPMSCLFPLVVGAVIVLIVVAILALWRSQWPAIRSFFSPSLELSAREIVQARYARGEIDRQEYQQLLQDLAEPGQGQQLDQSEERA